MGKGTNNGTAPFLTQSYWPGDRNGGQRNGKRCIQMLHKSSVIDRVEKGARAGPVGQGGDVG